MSCHIQINPTAEALQISFELVEVLEELIVDFDIRYCYIEPSDEAIAALGRVQPQGTEERQAIGRILSELERGDAVELLVSC